MIAVSIIVLTTSFQSEHTRRCLEAVEKNSTLPYELFVLRDDKASFGFSKDNNRLIRASGAKYIILLNDDCFVQPRWLERMIEKAEEDPGIGLVGAKLYGLDGRLQEELTTSANEVGTIPFALVLIKREVVQKIGFMDETFRLGNEDTEYCMRAKKAGYKCVISSATAIHQRNTSLDFKSITLRSRGAYYFDRNLGRSRFRLMVRVVYDFTYPYRKFVMGRAPQVFSTLRKLKVYAKKHGLGL